MVKIRFEDYVRNPDSVYCTPPSQKHPVKKKASYTIRTEKIGDETVTQIRLGKSTSDSYALALKEIGSLFPKAQNPIQLYLKDDCRVTAKDILDLQEIALISDVSFLVSNSKGDLFKYTSDKNAGHRKMRTPKYIMTSQSGYAFLSEPKSGRIEIENILNVIEFMKTDQTHRVHVILNMPEREMMEGFMARTSDFRTNLHTMVSEMHAPPDVHVFAARGDKAILIEKWNVAQRFILPQSIPLEKPVPVSTFDGLSKYKMKTIKREMSEGTFFACAWGKEH